MKIYTFIQFTNGKPNRNSLEALAGTQQLAEQIGGQISILTFEDDISALESIEANEIIQLQNELVTNFHPLAYIATLEQLIVSEKPDLVVFGHTYEARDWVPRLSARLDFPFLADCIGFNTGDQLLFTRQLNQGKINSDIEFTGPLLVSFQSGAYRLDAVRKGNSNHRIIDIQLHDLPDIIRRGEKFQEEKGSVDLSRADIIVSIGRGIGKEENIGIARELAKALKAEVGSSRPIVDYGWLPHDHQVGSSGQTVSPKLYIAIGISGAIQHQVGMKTSDHIIAINKDENAPIFEIADIGIISDLFDIIPKLTDRINAAV